MPVNPELELIAQIAHDADLRTVLQAELKEHMLGSLEARGVFSWMLRYFRGAETRNLVPTRDRVLERFPQLDLPEPSNRITVLALCRMVHERWLQRQGEKLCETLMGNLSDDPLMAFECAMQDMRVLRATVSGGRDIILSRGAPDTWARYEAAKNSGALPGIPYPAGWGRHDERGLPLIRPGARRQDHPLNEETRGIINKELIILYGRPKCVVEGQRVMGRDGGLYPIEAAPTHVPTKAGHQITFGRCDRSDAGKKDAVRITTTSGYTVAVGVDHPLLLPDMTYAAAGELEVGMYIGVARRLPEPTHPENSMSEDAADLLGNLVGDGNYTRNEVQFTKTEPSIVQHVAVLAHRAGAALTPASGGRAIEYRITTPRGQANPVLTWLRELGCAGQLSRNKRVPTALFRCDNTRVARFLSGYTDTDGGVKKTKVYWSTASEGLARDIKHLLLRFGVVGCIHAVETNYGTQAYEVAVQGQEQHVLLARVLTLHSVSKRRALRALVARKIKRKRQDDSIPYSEELFDTIMRAKGKKSWKHLWSGFSRGKLFRRTGRISRHLLRRLAQHLDAPELLEWADSDIRWEPITATAPLGPRRCHDVTMAAGEPAFVVEDFITHNSMKTWLAVDIGVEAYERHRCRVLFYTKELSPPQVQDRIVARLARIRYGEMRRGTLSRADEEAFRAAIDILEGDEKNRSLRGHSANFLITEGWGKVGSSDIDALSHKAEEFEPDLIIADAAYLMQEHAGHSKRQIWEAVTGISRALKGMAKELGIPVIATTQANRSGEELKGANVSEIAYADAFGQDCDLAVRIIKQEKAQGEDGVWLDLIIPAAREITLAGLRLDVSPADRFILKKSYRSQSQIRALLVSEARRAQQEEEAMAQEITAEQDRVGRQQAARNHRQEQRRGG